MPGVQRNRKQAALVPLEVLLAALRAGGPDFRRADTFENVNQFLVEVIFGIESAARRNFTDVHTGETFHSLKLNVRAAATRSFPRRAA